jgi:hypothetical protein
MSIHQGERIHSIALQIFCPTPRSCHKNLITAMPFATPARDMVSGRDYPRRANTHYIITS